MRRRAAIALLFCATALAQAAPTLHERHCAQQPSEPQARAKLIGELQARVASGPSDERSQAADTLGCFGEASRDAVPAMIRLFADDNGEIQANAVDAVAALGRTAVPALRAALSDSNPRIRDNAVRALRRIDRDAVSGERWPGRPPDCWKEPRFVHEAQASGEWQRNTTIRQVKREKPGGGTLSPNKGYLFVLEGGRPTGKVTIHAEKDHLVEIEFRELFALSDVRWINEKLLFMRPWWGRIAGTDVIYDVENEIVVHAETVTDGSLAHRQFLESCPIHGCDCIKKR
jgi:HEAT repeats